MKRNREESKLAKNYNRQKRKWEEKIKAFLEREEQSKAKLAEIDVRPTPVRSADADEDADAR